MKTRHKKYWLGLAVLLMMISLFANSETDDKALNNASRSVSDSTNVSVFNSKMSGISFSDIDGFWDKWHLVTVRYRQDTKEMRFIYANDIAWETIKTSRKNGTLYPSDYPDGSMFGKVSYALTEDQLLTSSLMPDHVLRYQIMSKQKKKDSSNHGWGYAIFAQDGNINTLPNKIDQTIEACAVCHEIAGSRGYVFIGNMDATPIPFPMIKHLPGPTNSTDTHKTEPVFNKRVTSDFGQEFSFLGVTNVEVSEMQHAQMFSGTLNEMFPLLISHTKETGRPSILMSTDKQLWSVVYKDPQDEKCFLIKTKMDMQFLDSKESIRNRRACQ